ncbi:MAG TPA: TolC family protein [Candidatus Eremiobacteraceae bacterium]|nr:TolC family protein [Candidatus Eremiobacteraceae bacterium]
MPLAGPSPVASPAQAGAMTLDQAVDFAMRHNTAVLQARAQAMAAGSTLAHNRSLELPDVSANAQSVMQRQSNNSGSFAQFGLSPSANFSQNTAQLQGSQNVLNLTTSLEAKQAKRSYDAALENLRLTQQQTKLAVENAYYTLVQDADLVTLAQYDQTYQRTLRDIAVANYKAGKVAGIDTLKAQVQLTSSEQRLASAQADADDARENLAQTVGADPGQQFALATALPSPTVPSLDVGSLQSIALVQRPEVAIAQANLDNARAANSLVDAPNTPTVQLAGGWGNQFSPTANAQAIANFNNCIANLGIAVNPAACPGPGASHFFSIGLTSVWTLPLLDWGSRHAAHKSASAAISSTQALLDAAQRQARIDVEQAVRRLKVERENLALATANADVAQQVAQTSTVQYKVGLISQIEVTSSEQTYLQAAKDLLVAQIGYALAVEKLKLATGTL